MKPKITIVMPFHNEKQEPIATLNSLYETAPLDLFKVIVIDDVKMVERKTDLNVVKGATTKTENLSTCGGFEFRWINVGEKFSIIRLSDEKLMETKIASKDKAQTWVDEYLKSYG